MEAVGAPTSKEILVAFTSFRFFMESRPDLASAVGTRNYLWKSLSSTARRLSGSTGRALSGYNLANAAICDGEASMACFRTYHFTGSEQGGVVSEPSKT